MSIPTPDTDTIPERLRVGVVGLGTIGGGVAVSLARRGRVPAVYDIRPDAADGLDGIPPVLASAAEVARNSDVVIVAVVDTEQVRAALRGEEGILAGARAGLTVAVLSTVTVPEVHELARECAVHDVALLDCGVTPGHRAAENGLVAMVGGDDTTVRRATTVLADFAKRVVHCGPLGAGMATKIARNVITYGSWRVAHEAATLAHAAGVDPATLIDVVHDADPTGETPFFWLHNRIDKRDVVESHGPQVLRLMDKDLAAAQQLARDNKLDVPVVDATRTHGADTVGITTVPESAPDRRQQGLQTMGAVYGANISDRVASYTTPTQQMTIDHVFGEIWSRPGLSIRDRRLLVMGATAALGRADLIEVQARGALINGELSTDQLQEAVLQLHYYVGWGNGIKVQEGADAAVRSLANAAASADEAGR